MNWQDILKDSGMDIDSGFGSDWTVHHMDTYKLQGVESDFNYAGLYSDIEFVYAQREGDSIGNKSDTFPEEYFDRYYDPVVNVDFLESDMKPSQLFMMTQNVDRPWVERFPNGFNDLTVGDVKVTHKNRRFRSTMVGDIFVDERNNNHWFVSNQGFKKINLVTENDDVRNLLSGRTPDTKVVDRDDEDYVAPDTRVVGEVDDSDRLKKPKNLDAFEDREKRGWS